MGYTAGPGANFIDEEEQALVRRVLEERGGTLRHRPHAGLTHVEQFEQQLMKFLNVEQCIATNSGSTSLYMMMRGLDIGAGDEVIMPGYSFAADVMAILFAGATPVLCEVDESLCMDPEDVKKRITKRTKAIMPVHMLGAPSDMDALASIANQHGVLLLEDVAQALGGSFRGRQLGSIGKVGTYSFNPYKLITGSGGGAVVTSDTEAYERMFAAHHHGCKPARGPFHVGAILGSNFRMPEICAAMLVAQANKMQRILDLLKSQKAKFTRALGELKFAKERRLNDPEGDSCTNLVITYRTAEQAKQAGEALGCRVLVNTGFHVYSNMKELIEGKVPAELAASFARGKLPRTDDLLDRSIILTVGIGDNLLGAAFGINPKSTDDEIKETAAEFHRRMAAAGIA